MNQLKVIRPILCAALTFILMTDSRAADRYETMVGGNSLTLADGETAIVVFAGNLGGSSTQFTYQKAGSPAVRLDNMINTSYTRTGSNSITTLDGASSLAPLPLVGPATLSLTDLANTKSAIVCLRVTTTEIPASTGAGANGKCVHVGGQGVPSTAVVIPEESGGPVEIILESSTDLVTWTRAEPGTYGASTEKRFFRVRAVQAPAG